MIYYNMLYDKSDIDDNIKKGLYERVIDLVKVIGKRVNKSTSGSTRQ